MGAVSSKEFGEFRKEFHEFKAKFEDSMNQVMEGDQTLSRDMKYVILNLEKVQRASSCLFTWAFPSLASSFAEKYWNLKMMAPPSCYFLQTKDFHEVRIAWLAFGSLYTPPQDPVSSPHLDSFFEERVNSLLKVSFSGKEETQLLRRHANVVCLFEKLEQAPVFKKEFLPLLLSILTYKSPDWSVSSFEMINESKPLLSDQGLANEDALLIEYQWIHSVTLNNDLLFMGKKGLAETFYLVKKFLLLEKLVSWSKLYYFSSSPQNEQRETGWWMKCTFVGLLSPSVPHENSDSLAWLHELVISDLRNFIPNLMTLFSMKHFTVFFDDN